MSTEINHLDLPEDAVIDIVSRLPVKSLKRFRCVCKPWCARFENPDFITNHHLKQKNANNFSLLVIRLEGLLHTDIQYQFSELTQALNVKQNISMQFLNECLCCPQVLGHRNGVLCLSHNNMIALWNPATREFKLLPESSIKRPPCAEYTSFCEVGFGFASKTNDYKVLRFVINYRGGGVGYDDFQYELYTLNSDSWREIPVYDKAFAMGYSYPIFDTYSNGCYHWQAESTDGREIVLSFDMADEVFSTVPLADFGISWTEYWLYLASINESLAAIVCPREGMEKCFDIWVMKEYGVKESWTKQWTIGPICGVNVPLGLWKNGGLFLESSDEQLVLYDPQTQELKNLQIQVYENAKSVVNYVESLVPINGRQELEEHIFRVT